MNYLILAVIDEIEQCSSVMEAWEAAGVSGITILESTGLGRIRLGHHLRDDLPLMPSLRNLMQTREEHHRTIFTIVRDEAMIDRLFEVTDDILGGLDQPNKGIIIALPVVRTMGIPDPSGDSE